MKEKPAFNKQTSGVLTLLGDPRKAIWRLAVPMVIAMSIQTIYNLADAIWVSGINREALAAVGYFFPFMMLTIAISVGLGVGGGSAISRSIGARDKITAEKTAEHMLVIMAAVSVLFTLFMLIFQKYFFTLMGVGSSIEETLAYSTIMFAGTFAAFFPQIANSILRSEGDANRAMYAMLFGAVSNIILDPLFIFSFKIPFLNLNFGLNLGIAGAAYATVLSMVFSTILCSYWLFIKKDTFVDFHFKVFRWDTKIISNIINVGLPATIAQASMSIMMFSIIKVISIVSGDSGVAVFNAGWRIVMIAILPMLGMGTAVTAVCGAAYGARSIEKIKTAYRYAVSLGFVAEIAIAVLTFVFAPIIVKAFTWSEDTHALAGDITVMLRIMSLSYPAIVNGILSSHMFQGTGNGMVSLFLTIIRTILLASFLAWLFGIFFGWGQTGVYWAIILSNMSTSLISMVWVQIFYRQKEKLWAE
ncbi:MAG: MATE family efflux transporter [Spirochaetes bacterium]|nr:MATE family efflux transporter [Spirochaetota bacterium]